MELAIPLLALGGMYVVSNQNQNKQNVSNSSNKKENFASMGKKVNYLPNTNIPASNYPITNTDELVATVQEYPSHNQATDKYLDQNIYEKKARQGMNVGDNIQQIHSLSGNYMNSNEFKHNNMVPFNGPKLKGQIYNNNNAESRLDNMVGSGSQVIKKIEQAPLFNPQENVQWAYGAPNMSDFYQSRVNPAMKNNMVKPFEAEYVAPGLNQGYGNQGSGGFNSGMESRDSWLPKTVDELRVATNPKEEFALLNHEGPAQSSVKNIGIEGRVEKYRPDTFYINSQDRWLTTTGAEKANRLNPIEIIKPGTRNETTTYYAGAPSSNLKTASYVPTNYTDPKRAVLPVKDVGHSAASGRHDHTAGENYIKSFSNYNNNRSTTRQTETFGSGFSSAIGAVIAPIMDILRPSRREEYVNNIRIYGDAGSSVSEGYVLTPGDVPNVTIKETTIYTPNSYINNQINGGGYQTAEQQPVFQQRDTTTTSNYGTAGGAGARYGDMNYDYMYRQHNNDIKEATAIAGRTNQGNANIFTGQMAMGSQFNRNDCSPYEFRVNAPSSVIPAAPSIQSFGKINMPEYKYQTETGAERMDPGLLNAFRENPYTQSLSSF